MVVKTVADTHFTCYDCKETFPKKRSDEEAIQEKDILFPGETDMVISCEDCFIKIMEFNEPGQNRYKPFVD